MIEIKDLLSRFENIILSEDNKREGVRKALSEVVGVEIEVDKIKIKGGTVYLEIKPIYKSEIYLKRELIAKRLQELLLNQNSRLEFR